MKIHPREHVVSAARGEISAALHAAADKHDLTYGELVAILSSELAGIAKYQIRQERHPNDPDKPGGLA